MTDICKTLVFIVRIKKKKSVGTLEVENVGQVSFSL